MSECDFLLRHLGDGFDNLTEEQKRKLKIKIRNFDCKVFDTRPPPPLSRSVDDRGTNNNNNDDDDHRCKCVGAEEEEATTTEQTSVFLQKSSRQENKNKKENNSDDGKRKSRLLVRSLSDGAKSKSKTKSTFCLSNNLSQEGGRRDQLDLQVAFKSLTLTSADFKSLSDSKLFCCSKDVDEERSDTTTSSFPEYGDRDDKIIRMQKVFGNVNGSFHRLVHDNADDDNKERLFLGEGRRRRRSVSSTLENDRMIFGEMRRQVVKMLEEEEEEEDEDEFENVVVLCSDQLKCPTGNDRGSLGSSASLELVSFTICFCKFTCKKNKPIQLS
jgi:hypothetical protein